MRYKNLLSAKFSSFFSSSASFLLHRTMSDILRVEHHLWGFGIIVQVLQWPQLICTWIARNRHKCSINRVENCCGGSLIIHLFAKQIKRRTAQSNISHKSAPAQELIPEGKAAGGGGGGDGGSLFIPSATAWNIHAADIPQRKHRLVQMHPSTGDIESVAGAHLRGSLKCRFSSTQRIQAHIPELNQGPATTGLGRWENTKLLFSE